MHQHPAFRNGVGVLAPDLQAVELLARQRGTGADPANGKRTVTAAEAFAFIQDTRFDEGAGVPGPGEGAR